MKGKSFSAKTVEAVRDGEENPFWTIEAIGEHVGACWGALAKMGIKVWEDRDDKRLVRERGEVGSITYHLRAIDEYQQSVFNAIAALLPDIKRMSEGETTALNKLKLELTQLAERHQREWERF